ncbi:hypothetical protein, partial [Candidatus Poriferisodalis sp.]|uniref:hypothetical protein n=1 Tax=Candidatus Poriferisodalis sp. TaxID=3101277 RepID=UPI003B0278BF
AVTNDSVSNFDVGTVLTPRQGENRIMPASLGLAGGWPLIEPGSSIEVQLVHGVDSEEDGSGVPRNLKRAVILVAERLHAGDSVDGVKDQLEELTRDWMSGNTVVVVPPEPDVTTLYADAHDIRFMSATDQAFIESSRTSSTTNRITPPDIVVPPGENGQYVSFFYPSARGVLASAILAGFESIASLEDMGQVVVDGETGHHWQSRTVFFPSLNGFAWTLT